MKKTSPTFSVALASGELSAEVVTFSSFSDEISKIAAEHFEPPRSDGKVKLKKWLKNTALIGAGTGIGTGAGMIAEKLVRKYHPEIGPMTKMKYLSGLASAATMAGMLAKMEISRTRHEKDRE